MGRIIIILNDTVQDVCFTAKRGLGMRLIFAAELQAGSRPSSRRSLIVCSAAYHGPVLIAQRADVFLARCRERAKAASPGSITGVKSLYDHVAMASDVKSPPASSAFTAFRNVSACNRSAECAD
jgi:hypothetical protein